MAKTIRPLKATLYILLVAITLGFASSARIIDEVQPNESNPLPTTVPAANPLPSGQISLVVLPVTAVSQANSPLPETDDEPSVVPTLITDVAPVAAPAIPVTTLVVGPVTTTPIGPHVSFFMHDILGGSHPSVRVVIGLVATTVLNAPFSKPDLGYLLKASDDKLGLPSLENFSDEAVKCQLYERRLVLYR
ncbi:hypothetical protein C1H46_001556 [Malus baccata]|uniref:Dirigent protein n=1 Tax=Malus baccata TaxID=106549 RepID=A0A540NQT9_MALBA|nr:hypothetical protein C1H46_001556 [Malus baccata]